MFSKILIANRGEIAVRIIRACKEMGIASVAVYSQADAEALHVALADESYCIGGPAPADSYLNQERIVSAALAAGAQAIHPGYGFLSENAQFASLCGQNGLVFIGPSPESMEELSDKAALKDKMAAGGLPVIPGTGILQTEKEALEAAGQIGYPVMLKASAGGGGRGIRLAVTPEELSAAFPLAVAEGDTALFIWKNSSTQPATSRSRSWPMRAGRWSVWGSGTAPSSGGTKSSLRNPPLRRCPPPSGRSSWPCAPRRWPGWAMWGRAPWNFSWTGRETSGSWR